MEGLGPGTLLGGRYTVRARLLKSPDAERWSAHDEHLSRDVAVLCFAGAHPHADAAIDAARQVGLVDNSRLVRVLDVGQDDHLGYIVEEALADARSIADLVPSGDLAPEEVRRLVGEAALGLDVASGRGLHHQRLNPESIVRLPDGRVKVLGTAVTAALAGVDEVEAVEAERNDAVGLVAILYAGLTGVWPHAQVASSLPSAHRIVGGVPAPSELNGTAPAELDDLCAITLNDDLGPARPGDVAGQLAPWSLTQVEGSRSLTPGLGTLPDPTPLTPPPPTSMAAPGDAPSLREANGHLGTPAEPGVLAGALGSATHAADAVGRRTSDLARAMRERAQERRDAQERAEAWTREHTVSIEEAFSPNTTTAVEAPAPLLPQELSEPLDEHDSRLALVIIAGLLVLALIFGLWGVTRIGSNTDLGLGNAPTLSVPNSNSQKATTKPGTATASTSPSAVAQEGDIPIRAASAYDPQGDNLENNAELARMLDGNPDTYWRTEGYNSTDFGGLKSSVGFTLDLGSAKTVRSVTLALNVPVSVSAYVGTAAGTGGVQSSTSVNKDGMVRLTFPENTSGSIVTVLFTKLAPSTGGRYRALVSDVTVQG